MSDFGTKERAVQRRVEEAMNRAMEVARLGFMERGVVYPFAVLLIEQNPQTGKDQEGELLLPVPPEIGDFSDSRNKALFGELVRRVAAATRAVGVVFISEAWIRCVELTSSDPVEMARAKEEAVRAAQGGLAGKPGSVEVVIVTAQTATRHGATKADIDRTGDRPALLEWTPVEWVNIGAVEGQLADLLPAVSQAKA